MILFAVAVLLLVAASEAGKPRELWSQGLYQGDIMILDEHGDRNAIVETWKKWDSNTVPYVIDRSIDSELRGIIQDAIKQYHDNTCVKFVPRTTQKDFVRIFAGDGCYSLLGCVRQGEQPLSLGDGCEFVGTAVHELGHAIGFDHEQNRSDRDDYIVIYFENINEDGEGQFDKLMSHENQLLTPFDYEGIMLYGEYAFSIWPGRLKTMEDKWGKHKLEEPYDKDGMTASDIKRVNLLYNC